MIRIPRVASSIGWAAISLVLTLLGLLAVTFFIGRILPADPVLAVVGDRATASAYAQARHDLGLDQPIWWQFMTYCKHVAAGNFGMSTQSGNPVWVDIRRVFPATIELATLSTLVGALIGIPCGVFAAVKRNGLTDHLVRVVGLMGYSVPTFWLGLVLLLVFYLKLGWTGGPSQLDVSYEYMVEPTTGLLLLDAALQGQWEVFANAFSHLVLPVAVLGFYSSAYISRMTRSFMLQELSREYITMARGKGLSETAIIFRHALRNAAVPLITVVALSYASLLEGSVLTETVFAWPGIGQYLTGALNNADMNAVLGATVVVGTVFVLLNMAADISYRVLDPRTR
jgi:peptide/nickel transport system permease protein